jgi:hypothetical protein
MRKAILGAASALALASPAVAADLPVNPYSEAPSYERHTSSTGLRRLPLSSSRLPSFPRPSWFAGLSLSRRRHWWTMHIQSMRPRACTTELVAPAHAQVIPKSLEQGGTNAALRERKNAWTVGVAAASSQAPT